MLDILRLKFDPDSPLTKRLLTTYGAPLIEGNRWGDKYWGVCNGAGLNRLGELLMQVREERRPALGNDATTTPTADSRQP